MYSAAVKSKILNVHLTLWRGLPTNLTKSQYYFEGSVKTTAQAWSMIQQFNAYSFSHPSSIQQSKNGIAFTAPYPVHPPAAFVDYEQIQYPPILGGLLRGPIDSIPTVFNTVVVGNDCVSAQTAYPGSPSAQQQP